jgi:hypothetical protein
MLEHLMLDPSVSGRQRTLLKAAWMLSVLHTPPLT